MNKTANRKASRTGRQKMEDSIRGFIGSAPVQAALEISGGAFPFLHNFAPLYVRGQAMGFDAAALREMRSAFAGQAKNRQKYDIIFVHSVPPAAALCHNFTHEILPHILRAVSPGGKMLLIECVAAKELRKMLREAELDLVKAAKFPASEAGVIAAEGRPVTGGHNIYFIRNPQILMA